MEKNYRSKLVLLVVALLFIGIVFLTNVTSIFGKVIYPQRYSEYVEYYAAKYSIDANRVYAIIRTESGFDPKAESNVGARGLMQITEETFDWIKSKIAPTESVTFDDLYNPEVNIRFGVYFLAVCFEEYDNDLATAAAAYHSGRGTVNELLQNPEYSVDGIILHTFPYTQMRNYVIKVCENYEKYMQVYPLE